MPDSELTTEMQSTSCLLDDGSMMAAPQSKTKVLIGICTLNEANNIAPLIQQLRQHVPFADILVVDDQSEDDTAGVVQRIGDQDRKVRVKVRQGRGLGGAIRFAMVSAIQEQYDLFINMDADFSHSPADVPALLRPHFDPGTGPRPDVVIGSRYITGGKIAGWPLHRKLMSRLLNRFSTMCLRLPVRDCSGSMRCYRVCALENASAADLRAEGYSVLEEILVCMHRGGAAMTEVPIVFTDRTRGQSKLTLRESLRSMIHIIKLATSQIGSVDPVGVSR